MKAEEKKITSIPQAIGLFMIFKALFYRNSLEGVQFPESTFYSFVQFSENTGFYLFLCGGIALCLSQKFIFYYLAYFSCFFTLFGAIYAIQPNRINTTMLISFVTAHILLCMVLYWSQTMIKKILTRQKELRLKD